MDEYNTFKLNPVLRCSGGHDGGVGEHCEKSMSADWISVGFPWDFRPILKKRSSLFPKPRNVSFVPSS